MFVDDGRPHGPETLRRAASSATARGGFGKVGGDAGLRGALASGLTRVPACVRSREVRALTLPAAAELHHDVKAADQIGGSLGAAAASCVFHDCRVSSNAAIRIVAKFEYVSETAYGKMMRVSCRMAPHV